MSQKHLNQENQEKIYDLEQLCITMNEFVIEINSEQEINSFLDQEILKPIENFKVRDRFYKAIFTTRC
jgi:deoxyxylulose-5-phosphate synthase